MQNRDGGGRLKAGMLRGEVVAVEMRVRARVEVRLGGRGINPGVVMEVCLYDFDERWNLRPCKLEYDAKSLDRHTRLDWYDWTA